MTDLTSDIWSVYLEYEKHYQIKGWGMKYFTSTINVMLVDYLPNYGIDSVNEEIIKQCIEMSGLVTAKLRQTQ